MTSGAPSIHHSRASNPEVNLQKETPGYPVNEVLWRRLANVALTADSVAGSYMQIAEGLAMDGDYWVALKSAMATWASLFANVEPLTLKRALVA